MIILVDQAPSDEKKTRQIYLREASLLLYAILHHFGNRSMADLFSYCHGVMCLVCGRLVNGILQTLSMMNPSESVALSSSTQLLT